MNFAKSAMCAAAPMALAAQYAEAAPALATNNVNMRQGPGTNYPVITTIPGGSTVAVIGCQSEWCTVAWRGQTGYSIATSFDQGGGAPPPGAGGPSGAGRPAADCGSAHPGFAARRAASGLSASGLPAAGSLLSAARLLLSAGLWPLLLRPGL